MEPTQQGGLGPNNITPMSEAQAGEALAGLLGTKEFVEGHEVQSPESEEQAPKEEAKAPSEPEKAEKSDKEVTTEETESAPTFDALEELAEATGLGMDKILELKARVKVDGEESAVPLAQILKSYQLEGHLNRENMKVAEARKAFEAEREASIKDFQSRLQQADTLVKTLENQFLKEMETVDWVTLRATDPAEYSAKRQDFIERNFQIQQLKQQAQFEAERLTKENTEKQQKAYQEFLKKQQEALNRYLPEWSDPAKGKAEKTKLRNYLLEQGFQDAEVSNIGDHRAILMARKAMLYDEMSKKAAVATKKVTPLPKFQKPGTKTTDDKTDKLKEATDRLRKTHSVEDAADLIMKKVFKG